jgi:hypothetical protein
MRLFGMPVNPSLVSWRLRDVETTPPMRKMWGRVHGMAWCLVVGLGACGLLRAFRGRGLGVAAGPFFRGFLQRVVPRTLVAPLRLSGGVRAGRCLCGWPCRCCGFGRSARGRATDCGWRWQIVRGRRVARTGGCGFGCHDSVAASAASSSPSSASARRAGSGVMLAHPTRPCPLP